MLVFRLTRNKYAKALNGKGAARSNNRWNSKGTEIIYTSESRALALAEVAVHLSVAAIPSDFVMLEIEIPDNLTIETVRIDSLQEDWDLFPNTSDTQLIGDRFIEHGKLLILKVPSAVVPGDFNFLINPNHKDFKKIKVKTVIDFRIDQRLFAK